MKQVKVIARQGEVNYYTGAVCKYVMVALTGTKDTVDKHGRTIINTVSSISYSGEESTFEDAWTYSKVLFFGVALCNPLDEFNFEKGKQIAMDKILNGNFKRAVAFSHHGMVDAGLVNYLLSKEMKLFEKDPGAFLTAYNKDRDDYRHEQALKECADNLTPDESAYLEVVSHYDPEYLKLLDELIGRPDLVAKLKDELNKPVEKS